MLIGLTGRAGHGKDTAANALAGYRKYAFADPIKEALNAMFGFHHHFWEDREWKETPLPGIGRSPRFLAQTLGTEWGRERVRPTLWVDLFIMTMRRWQVEQQATRPYEVLNVVVSDVRFPNEAKAIKELGGRIVRVIREGGTDLPGGGSGHQSEAGIPPELLDHTIRAPGVDELRAEIRAYAESFDEI
jgi:hypothetical protein